MYIYIYVRVCEAIYQGGNHTCTLAEAGISVLGLQASKASHCHVKSNTKILRLLLGDLRVDPPADTLCLFRAKGPAR